MRRIDLNVELVNGMVSGIAAEASPEAERDQEMGRCSREELVRAAGGSCRRTRRSMLRARMRPTCRTEMEDDSEAIRAREDSKIGERRQGMRRSEARTEARGHLRAQVWPVGAWMTAAQRVPGFSKI